MDIQSNKDLFIRLFKANIKRSGADDLLAWIMSTDFFEAPASSKFHLAEAGGLCEHSINVYNRLKLLVEQEKQLHPTQVASINDESVAICGLLHDLCKIDFYKVEYRNVKNQYGVWEKVPYYAIDEKYPFGHGEKSVFLIMRFIKLTGEEALAINWHMGGFDKRAIAGDHSISEAYEKSPLAVLTQAADFLASYIGEERK